MSYDYLHNCDYEIPTTSVDLILSQLNKHFPVFYYGLQTIGIDVPVHIFQIYDLNHIELVEQVISDLVVRYKLEMELSKFDSDSFLTLKVYADLKNKVTSKTFF